MRAILILTIFFGTSQLMATEPAMMQGHDAAGMSVSSRYVRSRTPVDEKPIPSDYFDLPQDKDGVENIEVELDDLYPEDPKRIPNYVSDESERSDDPSHQ